MRSSAFDDALHSLSQSGLKVVEEKAGRGEAHACIGKTSGEVPQGEGQTTPAAFVAMPEPMARSTATVWVRRQHTAPKYIRETALRLAFVVYVIWPTTQFRSPPYAEVGIKRGTPKTRYGY